jgi:hypothetical protein
MTFPVLKANLVTLRNNHWEPVMSDATFVLMNCDLVAVPLHAGLAGVITIYCGVRRATQLLGDPDAGTGNTGLGSVARRLPCASSGQIVAQSSGNISRRVTAPSVAFSIGAPK